MKTSLIMAPRTLAYVTGTGGAIGSNVLTPNPKEVWVTGANLINAVILDHGAGAIEPWDTGHLGFVRGLTTAATFRVYRGTASGGPWTLMATMAVAAPGFDSRPRHMAARAAATTTDRYVRLEIEAASGTPVLNVGVASAGSAWSPLWGYQQGAGRRAIDTGSRTRLLDGSFGINPGAIAKSWAWEFADLDETELLALERLVDSLGETRSVLVVENPDTAEAGINERIHWGMFTRLDQFERRAGDHSHRWAFYVEDWAG